MVLNLWESLEKLSDNFRDWIVGSDQFVILGFFLGGLLIFALAWKALHKHDQ